MNYTIEPLENNEDLEACARIQREVWDFGSADLVTARMLATCRRHGGILLGARADQGLIGFVFSFPVPSRSPTLQHSHMLAVCEPFRDQGVGHALKQAQAAEARLRGVELITWTFDPLEAKNAHLNFNKLGIVARRYYVNLYGEQTTSRLHSLGTDRFLAEWYLDGRYARAGGGGVDLDRLLTEEQALVGRCRAGVLEPGRARLELGGSPLLVEVPAEIQHLKATHPEVARQWRRETRRALDHYLGRGYRAGGFRVAKTDRERGRRTFYLLETDGD